MSLTLNDRIICDLDMLLLGGFAPLTGFLDEENYNSVVHNCRLTDGSLWAMPIVLPVNLEEHSKINGLSEIILKDKTGLPLAKMKVTSIFKPNLIEECEKVYGSSDTNHPYVKIVLGQGDVYYYGGSVEKIHGVLHYDFTDDRLSASQSRTWIKENGWKTILGFQTRNPMHRSHFELTKYALNKLGNEAKLLLTPVVGVTQTCDVNYHVRTRCYQKLMKYYDGNAKLVLLPLSMRMAGPREALWHAQIRKNYGCTHFVIGRDHAGPSYKKKDGSNFYGPYDAQDFVEQYKNEIGIDIITSKMIVYVENLAGYKPMDEVVEGDKVLNISGTEQRRLLKEGLPIPDWFSFPEIVEELRWEFKPLNRRGLCLYFVGLSGSGKSTIANYVKEKLMEREKHRNITLLDADIIRTHLSKGLGFSRADRSTNVQRIGYVASEIVKHYGICLCANIAPYADDRAVNRDLIGAEGNYVEIFMDTSLEDCEKRDVKGLYKLAREGKIKEFTGISDPFERPENPELVLNGSDNINDSVETVIKYLEEKEFI